MKEYLVYWWDYHREIYRTIQAENLKEARCKAFQMMCDCAGDRIYSVTVYEKKTVCDCQGEMNPRPNSAFCKLSHRDYMTGRRI
jgi:hypothetical protein